MPFTSLCVVFLVRPGFPSDGTDEVGQDRLCLVERTVGVFIFTVVLESCSGDLVSSLPGPFG